MYGLYKNINIGYNIQVDISDIYLYGNNSENYYLNYSFITISGNIYHKYIFINNLLNLNNNNNNQPSISYYNFDYTLSINYGGLPGINNNLTNLFSTSNFMQNILNPIDYNIDLTLPLHNQINNTTYTWNNINQQKLITIEEGLSSTSFNTFSNSNLKLGDRLLEIIAHKIFGNAKTIKAIGNSISFYNHDNTIWDHLVNTINNTNFQRSLFEQYLNLSINDITNLEETYDCNILPFNLEGTTIGFPMYLSGTTLSSNGINIPQLINGTNVGGSRLVNGNYNIPILIKIHD